MRVNPFIFPFACMLRESHAFVARARWNAKAIRKPNKMAAFVNLRGGAEPQRCEMVRATVESFPVLSQIFNVVHSSPLFGNSLVCMGLSAIGDILAQKFEHYEQRSTHSPNIRAPTTQPLDVGRTWMLASFGLFICGPLYSVWYPFVHELSRPWSLEKYGVWMLPVVKMVLELLFVEPLFLTSFFGYMNFAKGGNLSTLKQTILLEFLRTYKVSLAFWPPIMLISFRFVPVSLLPIVVNVANAFWDAFLSYQNSHSSAFDVNDDGVKQ